MSEKIKLGIDLYLSEDGRELEYRTEDGTVVGRPTPLGHIKAGIPEGVVATPEEMQAYIANLKAKIAEHREREADEN